MLSPSVAGCSASTSSLQSPSAQFKLKVIYGRARQASSDHLSTHQATCSASCSPSPFVYEVQIFGGDAFVLPWPSFLSYIPWIQSAFFPMPLPTQQTGGVRFFSACALPSVLLFQRLFNGFFSLRISFFLRLFFSFTHAANTWSCLCLCKLQMSVLAAFLLASIDLDVCAA